MVATDSDMMSPGEVQSSLQAERDEIKNNGLPQLGRQSSIYSLTLDEFQNTLSENGKNFGSMNMDEFLNSIWTAEEAQAQVSSSNNTHNIAATLNNTFNNNLPSNTLQYPIISQAQNNNVQADHHHKAIAKQPSLSRQGSLTLPPPLCRKTVEEVWTEIHKTRQGTQQEDANIGTDIQNHGSAQRQATFGEMTLEDFLVKAGVVREQPGYQQPPQPQPGAGVYQNNNNNPTMTAAAAAAAYMPRPVMPLGGPPMSCSVPGVTGVAVPLAAYQPFPQGSAAADASVSYPGNVKRGAVFTQQPPLVYGGRVGNGGAATPYEQVQGGVAMASPVSPASSDGLANQMDGNRYGMDMGGGMRGSRKRTVDGPIEKVVERRQRRMIKNRESAARSRARKQAYTVELEAELNQLKEENSHLRHALAEMEMKRKQQVNHLSPEKCPYVHYYTHFEEVGMRANTRGPQRANGNIRVIRRTLSF
ncbi:basic leucine zipper transcription factor [Lithospermum erythrorhizon]|uniref:Basic leucine zipper transcription factor n=1 Tax=Lithospermum erythrorhizon TaxID=34254 RepID=A0AAV3QI34_LITER